MIDTGHVETDELILQIEKKVKREYQQAAKEIQEKLDKYFLQYMEQDEDWRKRVKAGEVTQEQYEKWRMAKIQGDKRWNQLETQLAKDLHNSNLIARSIIQGYMPEVYAINHNFGTYLVEMDGNIDTSYTLYSRENVERILRDDPDLLPPPGKNLAKKIAANKDIRWQAGRIQSATVQGILQGESIPNLARRISRDIGAANYKDAVRYARTAMTGAENAGRQDAYKRAADMGVNLQRRWVATLDMRTRHEHRLLDLQVRDIDEPFEVAGEKIMFPGDPTAEPSLVWNCRCTEVPVVAGWVSQSIKGRSLDAVEGMTYDEWKNERKSSAGKGNEVSGVESNNETLKKVVNYQDSLLMATMDRVDYDEFVGMVNNAETGPLFEKFAGTYRRVEKKRGAGCYYPGLDVVEYDLRSRPGMNKYGTLAHEMGHMQDAKIARMGSPDFLHYKEMDAVNTRCIIGSGMTKTLKGSICNSDEFLLAMRTDIGKLHDMGLSEVAKIFKATTEMSNATSGIQDALDGFYGTQSKGILSWGHGEKYYNRFYNGRIKGFDNQKEYQAVMKELGFDASNLTKAKALARHYEAASELWANTISAMTVGGIELEVMEKYMPETLGIVRKIIKGVT